MTDGHHPATPGKRRSIRQTAGIILLCVLIAGLYAAFNVNWGSMLESVEKWRNRSRAGGAETAAGSPAAGEAIPSPLDPKDVNGENAFAEMKNLLSFGPSYSGSGNAANAARHIVNRLQSAGVNPVIDEFTDKAGKAQMTFRNVTATVRGQDKALIILACHYDTKTGIADNFLGANDSGSGAGLLLELARLLRSAPPLPDTVMLAFLDGEECVRDYSVTDGLHGSRRLAGQLKADGRAKDVLAVLVLDMIADRDLTITLPRNGTSQLLATLLEAARQEGVRPRFSLFEGSIYDDHVPFLREGMPAADIVDFEYGSAPGLNDFWHTDKDTLDRLSAESLVTVGRVVVRAIDKIMKEGRPRKNAPPR